MKNFIEVYDNALTDEQCDYIMDFMNKDGVLIEGAVNKGKGAVVCKEDKESWDIPMDIDNKKPDHLDPKHMDTYKKINTIKRGDKVISDLKTNKIMKVARNIKTEKKLLRPINMSGNLPGKGFSIFNSKKNILGMMPHPERMVDKLISNDDGVNLFSSLLN